MDTLIPEDSNPFYIVSPTYTRASAGINALYLLCHYLNIAGERAFIINYPPDRTVVHNLMASVPSVVDCPGNFHAPLLTQDIIDFYHTRKITPIVIYPEIFDNPLNAPFFGRYILNYPGKASLEVYSAVEDFAFAYSSVLAAYCTKAYPDRSAVDDILFIPTMDLNFWKREGEAPIRRGTCFYAGKMRRVHGTSPDNVPAGSVEIHNSVDMTPVDIRRYFWRSEAFYCFEDSALAIEAQLCGCPTVFVPNSLFKGTQLANQELGRDGSCVLGEEDGLSRASRTVGRVEAIIRSHIVHVPERIAELGLKWKAQAKQSEYRGSIDYPFEPRFVFVPKINASVDTPSNLQAPPPIVALEYHTMREIAREVWYEHNRHSLTYKAMSLLKTLRRFRPTGTIPTTLRTSPSTPLKSRSHDPKRIVLFAHFDRDGIIDDYVIYYLKKLQKISKQILFVSDCELRDGEAQKLRGIAEIIASAPHGEYDFGSWKRGFAALKYDLSEWDELIIANDSCYAPLFPLEQAFELIGACDFWGATKEPYSRLAADIAARRAERMRRTDALDDFADRESEDFDFLNSYFMVFKKKILLDPSFIDFWKRVSKQEDKERVIELYEIGLTKLLLSLNYSFSCFAVRAGAVFYRKFEIAVPQAFQLPWLRVLICRTNEELIPELDKELDRIAYPRYLIDKHIERMTGTAQPPHYYLPARHSVLQDISLGAFGRPHAKVATNRRR